MLETMLAPPPKKFIHKFDAKNHVIEIGLPARFLNLQLQNGEPKIWIEHCPDSAVKAKAEIKIFVTGAEVPDKYNYLGTYQDGPYVLHAYVHTEKK